MSERELVVRAATEQDVPGALELLALSMHRGDRAEFEALYRWKHLSSSFGPSPAWVACDGDRIVGLRVFMLWEFEGGDGIVRAARAVDTATHPDYQGRGIFTRLTLDALPALRDLGVSFIFNTPNDKSRPGYLKMGWHELGRLATSVRPMSIGGIATLVRSKVAASHWSEPAAFGVPVADIVGGAAGSLDGMLANRSRDGRMHTHITREYLTWRFGAEFLKYRAVVGRNAEDGVAFARVRRRGRGRELVVGLMLVPSPGARRQLVRILLRAARREADYALALGRPPGFLPLPKQGPIMTMRPLEADGQSATLSDFDFDLADIELF